MTKRFALIRVVRDQCTPATCWDPAELAPRAASPLGKVPCVQIATMIAGLLAARCADPDETIRRASLQQLTSLRIPSLVDVMLPPVEKLLDDPSPAVRAAAALAVLKVATLADEDIDLQRLWDKVDALMHDDVSAEVVHACVAVKLHREDESVLVKDAELVVDLMLRLQVRQRLVSHRPRQS